MENVALGVRWWPRPSSEQYRTAVAAVFFLFLVLAGGASRAGEPSQLFVHLASVIVIAASLWPLEFDDLPKRRWFLAIGVVVAIPILQLVPLPPEVWARLPGHAPFAQIATVANAVTWRPLSLTPDLTLGAAFGLTPAIAAAVCTRYLSPSGRILFVYGIVGVAIFSACLGFAQLAAGPDLLRLYRESSVDSAVGLFANRNHQALLLACALPLTGVCAGMRVRHGGDSTTVAIIAFATGAILEAGVVSTGSRMGLVLGGAGALGALACYRTCGIPLIPARSGVRILAACLTIVVGAALAFEITQIGTAARFGSEGPAAETRTAMLGPLISTAEAFMPLGAGVGSFDSVYRRFEPPPLLSTIYMNQAHNEPLQLAIEGGVPAIALLGVFCGWWLTAAWRAVRSSGAPADHAARVAGGMITLMLMIASLVDYPLRTPMLGALFIFACMGLMSPSPRSLNTGSRNQSAGARVGREARRWS